MCKSWWKAVRVVLNQPGIVLSSWLFNVFMDRVMREVKDKEQGVYSSPPLQFRYYSLQMT